MFIYQLHVVGVCLPGDPDITTNTSDRPPILFYSPLDAQRAVFDVAVEDLSQEEIEGKELFDVVDFSSDLSECMVCVTRKDGRYRALVFIIRRTRVLGEPPLERENKWDLSIFE